MGRRLASPAGIAVVLLAVCACSGASRSASDVHARCPTLDAAACERAHALAVAASTYADEEHDYVFPSARISGDAALARTGEGWRALPFTCDRPRRAPPQLDLAATDYAFVGVAVDDTLVSADADVGPILARPEPSPHEVALVAVAFVHDRASSTFDRGENLLERPSGECLCNDASHFAGPTRYGAVLAYAFRAPRREPHARAIDVVRRALVDPGASVREVRKGAMAIDGLARFLAGDAAVPLAFHVMTAEPVAYAAVPIGDLCDFATPELSPSPLDFGVAPYGTEARRTVHAINRSSVDLEAILGASTIRLPAGGSADLPLRWTPDGDAPGCETQTRDEAIPFLRVGGTTPRSARVLETVRTGRPTVERAEHIEPPPTGRDRVGVGASVRDWTCPRDFVRTSCSVTNADGLDVAAEPRGKDSCHFECRGPAGSHAQTRRDSCRFDALMSCSLRCPP